MKARPNVLYVTYVNPLVPQGGSPLRVHYLLKMLSKLANTTCVAIVAKDADERKHAQDPGGICEEYIEWERLPPRPVASVLRLRPTEMSSYFNPDYGARLRSIIRERAIDLLWLDNIFLADYLSVIDDPRIPVLFGAHNIESFMYRDKGRLNRAPLQKLRYFLKFLLIRHLEVSLAKRGEQFVSTSPIDAQYYASLRPGSIPAFLYSTVDQEQIAHSPVEPVHFVRRPVFLYTGDLKYEPTYDAVLYFHREIMPHVDRLVPSYAVYVVGKDPVQSVKDLHGEKIIVTGYVDSTLPYFRGADVFIVPLRGGSGTRLKIVEAMAAGIPIVTTSKGCEGLDVVDGVHVLIADTPELFARHMATLAHDAAARATLVNNAKTLVREHYDWHALEQPLKDLLAHAFAARPEGGAL